jgi:phage N-6-adenine-methyltransferase
MTNLINRVLFGDALRLLSGMPDCSIDACIADPMHGTARNCRYDWGLDPAMGDPVRHWEYHEPIYNECLRVLRPGGVLAWAQGVKFSEHFPGWFGGHETWRLLRRSRSNERVSPQLWIVQTREQQPVPFPADRDGVIVFDRLARGHPFPRPVEELAFLIEALTRPGQIVLDCFAGTGSTLVAAEQLGRRWIGCDLGLRYCQIAMGRLADLRSRRGRAQGKVDTSTPQWLFDVLNEQVRALTGRHFQLDAAASGWNAKCKVYFDERTDALRQDWSRFSPIFCNPPFRSELISQFATKALEAAEKGSTVVLLLPYWQRFPWFQEVKRRGQLQDIITPVAFEWPDGSPFVFNKDRRTLVVATLGPGVPPNSNGEAITRPQASGRGSAAGRAYQPQVPAGLGRPSTDPPVLTSYQSDNDHLMAEVARLYFRPGDRIADVTYGTGRFWRLTDLTPYEFWPSDLLTVPDRPYDFRSLPYRSGDFDVHVFDPPYMHHPSKSRGHDALYRNAETTPGFSHDDIVQLYREGMAEGYRILKRGGLMLVKCKDEIEAGRQRMSHVEIHDIATKELGMTVQDLFVLTQRSPAPHFGRSPRYARKNHSYLWVLVKGPCRERSA